MLYNDIYFTNGLIIDDQHHIGEEKNVKTGLPPMPGAMAGGDPHVAAALGAIGQMGSVWSGGGTIVAWFSLVAVAGIVGVHKS